MNVGIIRGKAGNGSRRPETRQCAAGRQSQAAAARTGEFAADVFNVLNFAQNLLGSFQNRLPRLGNRYNALAAADKNLRAQLLLQKPYLLGHTGLGSKQRLGRFRNVQIAAENLHRIAQLL